MKDKTKNKKTARSSPTPITKPNRSHKKNKSRPAKKIGRHDPTAKALKDDPSVKALLGALNYGEEVKRERAKAAAIVGTPRPQPQTIEGLKTRNRELERIVKELRADLALRVDELEEHVFGKVEDRSDGGLQSVRAIVAARDAPLSAIINRRLYTRGKLPGERLIKTNVQTGKTEEISRREWDLLTP